MRSVEIAEATKLGEKVVRTRIKELVSKGVILGFRPFLNVSRLGYLYFKIHFILHNLTAQKKRLMQSYIHQHPNTVYLTELVGGSDIEVELQVRDNAALYGFIRDMRGRFGDAIRDYYFMQYTEEYKLSYLPEMGFK